MTGVSLRAYARMRGCSLTAVQKAISSKRITTLPDGTIEPERADKEWAKNTFAGQTIHKPSAASPDRIPPVHESVPGSGDPVSAYRRARHYQREPMDVLSPGHPCRQVVLLSAAQMMKTEVLLNFLGFIADVDPGPVLVVEPRTEDAKALSKDRIAPMFRSTPVLRGKI